MVFVLPVSLAAICISGIILVSEACLDSFQTYFNCRAFIAKIKELFEQNLQQELDDSASSMDSSFSNGSCNSLQRREVTSIWRLYVQLMDEINGTASTLGKDGKFQLLICLSLR